MRGQKSLGLRERRRAARDDATRAQRRAAEQEGIAAQRRVLEEWGRLKAETKKRVEEKERLVRDARQASAQEQKDRPLVYDGERSRRARYDVSYARIVEAAADLVCARGVSGTSLDDIAEASATSKSALCRHFPDKDELMRAVIDLQTDRVMDALRQERVDSLAGLRRWRDARVAMSKASGGVGGCPLGSLVSELADRSERARALLAHGFQLWEAHLATGLRAMHDRGELDPQVSPADLATATIAAPQGGLSLAQTMRTSRPLELALDMAIDQIARHSV